jgi:predicted AlkP superfamily pyrophosphatase or phosphodiesterase
LLEEAHSWRDFYLRDIHDNRNDIDSGSAGRMLLTPGRASRTSVIALATIQLSILAVVHLIALGARADEAAAQPIVIVLSWDGLRHDYPDLAEFPGLKRLEHEGVRARRLRPGWPSNTFPGHVSMATGTYADVHGIVDNRFYDREKGVYSYSSDADWLQAEPLWIAAERQGVKAATYFWVGSESPWHGQDHAYRIAPFDGGRLESLKVEQMLAWLGLSEADRPQLIMSYWAGADSIGHNFGPDSARLSSQLAGQDFQLQRLMRGIDELGLWPSTTLILVSDHGMTLTGPGVDLAGSLQQAGIGARVYGGAVAHVFLDDVSEAVAAQQVVEQTIATQCADARVYPGRDLPAAMRLRHPSRTGDLVVVGPPPCSFNKARGFGGIARTMLDSLGWGFGTHGYDPDLPDMGGVFMAMGRSVNAGLELGEVRQIDLAATVSKLLGMEPPASSEGRPIF